jgi:hypothetical protein
MECILPSSVVGLDRGKAVVPSFSSRRVSSQTAFHVKAKGRTQNEKERTSHHDMYYACRRQLCLILNFVFALVTAFLVRREGMYA